MNKIIYTFAALALIVLIAPLTVKAMTITDIEQQLNLYKSQASSLLGASVTSLDSTVVDLKPMPPVQLPPVKVCPNGMSVESNCTTMTPPILPVSTDGCKTPSISTSTGTPCPTPMPPVPAPKSSTDDFPKVQLTPDQIKVIMQGLKYTDSLGSSMIIKDTIKPGQSDIDGKISVKSLQIFLNGTGCSLPTTGKYGAMTKKCVKDFQKRKGLKMDGIIGKNVRKAIAEEIDAAVASSTSTQTTQ